MRTRDCTTAARRVAWASSGRLTGQAWRRSAERRRGTSGEALQPLFHLRRLAAVPRALKEHPREEPALAALRLLSQFPIDGAELLVPERHPDLLVAAGGGEIEQAVVAQPGV